MGEAMIRGRRTRINYAKDWQYTTNDTATLVTSYIGNKTDVVVPSKINGKPVVLQNSHINQSGSLVSYTGVFLGNSNITSIKFGEGVSIANNNMAYVFKQCSNLISVFNIPSNVTNMANAFEYCYNLVIWFLRLRGVRILQGILSSKQMVLVVLRLSPAHKTVSQILHCLRTYISRFRELILLSILIMHLRDGMDKTA